MSAYEEYLLIQDFKRSNSATIDGVNYANVVAQYLYDTSITGWFKKLIFSIFFSTRITKNKNTPKDTLIYYSCRHKHRPDYDRVIEKIGLALDGEYSQIESEEHFSFRQIFHTLNKIKIAFFATNGYKKSVFHRVAAALLIAKYQSTTRVELQHFVKNKKSIITFCDAQAPENLLAQIGKTLGVRTYTAQHGQYRILDSSNMSPDAEVYENFVSDFMLCWGEATRRELTLAGYKPEQLLIVGWIKDWPAPPLSSPSRVFGVMLNGENGRNSNIALLNEAKKIANTIDYNYIVRLHPWSKRKQYEKHLSNRCIACGHFGLPDYIEKTEFSIAHMTGAIIEMLHCGAFVYLFDDQKLANIFRVNGLSYSSTESLISAIHNDKKDTDQAKSRFSQLYLWYNNDKNQESQIRAIILG